ncbi:MAG: YfcE family phosphodiesterase [Planctomycetota bacterium]|nr:YfcE family phosphodiesterase [Planctomycetota bacterium]
MNATFASSEAWQLLPTGSIGLLSDSHGDVARTRRGLELLLDHRVSLIVHCGDLGSEEVVDQLAGLPVRLVLGNVDPRSRGRYAELLGLPPTDRSLRLRIAGRRIGITHGHLDDEVKALVTAGPDYIVHGHTHRIRDETVNGIRFLNPGAVTPSPTSSVAILNPASGAFRPFDLPDP